jgi:hypothetical protein
LAAAARRFLVVAALRPAARRLRVVVALALAARRLRAGAAFRAAATRLRVTVAFFAADFAMAPECIVSSSALQTDFEWCALYAERDGRSSLLLEISVLTLTPRLDWCLKHFATPPGLSLSKTPN